MCWIVLERCNNVCNNALIMQLIGTVSIQLLSNYYFMHLLTMCFKMVNSQPVNVIF